MPVPRVSLLNKVQCRDEIRLTRLSLTKSNVRLDEGFVFEG